MKVDSGCITFVGRYQVEVRTSAIGEKDCGEARYTPFGRQTPLVSDPYT